ncbi:NAD(P)-binding protein [Aspergillus ibericus CBS 121593]|uniref:NAD(P)-binding protein n=1 Tax=Aspergillus ibericus CBS 121593 TaxID=1448316 RepID=A0A395GX27_9EURO|nr:NAD(P)-binding protein [Aspergillus ibericus CBS 121593]RAK99588.1 NAD(P)-binding protein [Aspergillus ibericus CBS 121593]
MATTRTFDPQTPAADIAAAFPESIQGKTIIITGVSPNSLGLATAFTFASQSPANLIITGRSSEKLEASIHSLKLKYPNTHYHALLMDLSSQSSVRAAATQLNNDTTIPTIDILINNAGVMAIPTLTLTEDGIETTFATNHLGHFLFTNLILPKIIKAAQSSSSSSPPPRIINLTSFAHHFSPIRFSDINFTLPHTSLPASEHPDFQKTELFTGTSHSTSTSTSPYTGFFSYAQSKTANILFTISLNEKLYTKYGISSFAVHPGAVDTNINRYAEPGEVERALKRVQELGFDARQKEPRVGANTVVWGAVDGGLVPGGNLDGKGVYLAECAVDEVNVAGFARDREGAERLWGSASTLSIDNHSVNTYHGFSYDTIPERMQSYTTIIEVMEFELDLFL